MFVPLGQYSTCMETCVIADLYYNGMHYKGGQVEYLEGFATCLLTTTLVRDSKNMPGIEIVACRK